MNKQVYEKEEGPETKLWISEMSSKSVGNTNILSICAL